MTVSPARKRRKRGQKQSSEQSDGDLDAEVDQVKADIQQLYVQKRERLKNLDFYLLDNSIRESTVGQLRSHTTKQDRHIQ